MEIVDAYASQKQLAIDMILMGEKKTEIAVKVGVQRQTLYNWLKDPTFKAMLQAQQRDLMGQADNYISSKLKTYIDKLDEIALKGKDQKLQAQVCMYLLDRVLGKAPTKADNKVGEESKVKEVKNLKDEFAKFRKNENVFDADIV